jgi:predicted NBD/HSP70 family sugar kinase
MEIGYVREVGRAESRGGKAAGLVGFNEKLGHVAGIDIGGHQISVAVSDLSGDLLAFERRELGELADGEKVIATVQSTLNGVLEELELTLEDLMAAGFSVPGAVDPLTGEVSAVANVPKWSESRLLERLGGMLKAPIVVENNVNAAMEGERWRGAARGAENAVFVAVGAGLGAGILIEGRIYRGWRGTAGEIGFQRELRDESPLEGVSGPLERFVSGRGIVERYRRAMGDAPVGMTAQKVFEAAAAGEAVAQRVIDETTTVLGGAIVNLCANLAPELVVLGGGVARAGEALATPIRLRLERSLPFAPRVVLSGLEDKVSVVGAVRLALDEVDRREFAFGLGEGGARQGTAQQVIQV